MNSVRGYNAVAQRNPSSSSLAERVAEHRRPRRDRHMGRFAPSYEEWTDWELADHAARLNIRRKTKMSREELIAALSRR